MKNVEKKGNFDLQITKQNKKKKVVAKMKNEDLKILGSDATTLQLYLLLIQKSTEKLVVLAILERERSFAEREKREFGKDVLVLLFEKQRGEREREGKAAHRCSLWLIF